MPKRHVHKDAHAEPRVFFVLTDACLELIESRSTFNGPPRKRQRTNGNEQRLLLANCADHYASLAGKKKDPALYRPDILHHCLLNILDSPLNKAGRIGGVFIKTTDGVLFEVRPHTRIPRTYKRFAGLIGKVPQHSIIGLRLGCGCDGLIVMEFLQPGYCKIER